MKKKFWMVWREGSYGASYQHPSLEAAADEAKRLCAQNLTSDFYVLEAVLHLRADTPPISVSPVSDEPIEETKEAGDGIPF
jgi:hypothetical protein